MDNLNELLLKRRSSEEVTQIAYEAACDTFYLDQLMTCFYSTNRRLSECAAWPVGKLADLNPDIFMPYMSGMIDNLKRPCHPAVIRNTLRIWKAIKIPEAYQAEIFDRSLNYMGSSQYPAAVRVYAMTACINICEQHPGLSDEVKELISQYYETGSKAFKARARIELKRLKKINRSPG